MKKMLLLAMILCLLAPCAAWAAVVSADLPVDRNGSGEDGMLPYIESAFTYGGKLYMTARNNEMALYVWSPETGETQKLALQTENEPTIVTDGQAIFQLDSWSGSLNAATLSDEGLTVGEALPFDTSLLMRQDGEYSYGVQTFGRVLVDGQIYLLTSAEDDSDYYSRCLYRVDTATGQTEKLYTGKGISAITRYQGGKLLCLVFDQDAYYQNYDYTTGKADASLMPKLQVFDMETRTLSDALLVLPVTQVKGLAYDPAKDIIYFAAEDGLYRKTAQGEPEHVNYLPGSGLSDSAAGLLIGSEYYVLADYSGVYIRSTDPKDKPETVLRVSGTSFDWTGREGYLAFTKKHPEVAVTASTSQWFSTAEALYQDFMTDTAADIYAINDTGILETLIRKGYATDMSGSQILSDLAKRMYPHMIGSFFKDDKLYAFPNQVYGYSQWAYSPSVLAEIGLTEDDLPKSILELIDFIVDWVDIYSLEHQQLDLFRDQYGPTREMLLSLIFQQQIAWCAQTGTPFTFDTPQMLALLNKVDEVASILSDLDPDEQRSTGIIRSWSDSEKITALFTMDYTLFGGYRGEGYDYVPLSIGLSQDMPMLNIIQMELLFMNPNTAHPDLAVALIEELAANADKSMLIQLCPDENTPIENSWYKQQKQSFDEYVQQLNESLQNAKDEAEKKQFEDVLNNLDDWAQSIERERYQVSEEMIAQYRQTALNVFPLGNTYSSFYASEDLLALLQRMQAQQISGEQFIRETEKILRKMRLESN